MASFGTHEEPIFYAHKYWAYYVLPVLTIYFGIGVIWLIYRILTAHNDEFIVTNKKVHISHGIFSKESYVIPLDKINNIQVSQGFFGKLLGYGTINIQSAAANLGRGLSYIAHPEVVKATIENAMDEKEDSHDKRLAGYIGDAVRGR